MGNSLIELKIKSMSKELEIARVAELPHVKVSDDSEIDFDLKLAHISKQTLDKYHDALNPRLSFGYRLRRFLSAQNEAGRIAKTVKDFALIFVPYGRQINTLTDFVTEQLTPKKNTNMNWIKNRLKEKSTWRGIVTVLTALGVSLSPGQSAAIVTTGVVLAGLFEAFFKDPQSDDA